MEHATTNVLKAVADVPIGNVIFHHCVCFNCTNVPSYFNSTSNLISETHILFQISIVSAAEILSRLRI